MKVDELIALGGPIPPTNGPPPPKDAVDEASKLYFEVYGPGLTSFFENTWYAFSQSDANAVPVPDVLVANQALVKLFATFLQSINTITTTDPRDMVAAGHLESCLVWALANLPITIPPSELSHRPLDQLPADDDATEARARVVAVTALLSNATLWKNPLTAPPPPADKAAADSMLKRRSDEFHFWYCLGQYLLETNSLPDRVDSRVHFLGEMRSVLDGRENRDVLYSMAVLREFSGQLDPAMAEQTAPTHLDAGDVHSKLAVAVRFIREESQGTGGTTNVVRRISELAYRAFVRPGVNVIKNSRAI